MMIIGGGGQLWELELGGRDSGSDSEAAVVTLPRSPAL